MVQDQKVFNKVSWQYMILDEAHSIKNINSIRWNTLLEFSCRNRLLLTGTPIQNSMSELWALLHFIMPNLFDSHEQFQEWFSKDIELHSQEKGELNEEQLRRLHKILKPFMLRRIKKDVESEIGQKTEYEINCSMTRRQHVLYNSIKSKLNSISDLFTSVDSKVKVENLMNLVMQFRKVCNHPELFERHIGKIPHSFKNLFMTDHITSAGGTTHGTTLSNVNNNYNNIHNKDEAFALNTNMKNCITYFLPKLIFDEVLCFANSVQINKNNNYPVENNNNNNNNNNNEFKNPRSLIFSRTLKNKDNLILKNNESSFLFSSFKNSNNSKLLLKNSSFFNFFKAFEFLNLLPINEMDFKELLNMDSMISQICLIHYLNKNKNRLNYLNEFYDEIHNEMDIEMENLRCNTNNKELYNTIKKKKNYLVQNRIYYKPCFVYLSGFVCREVFDKDDRLISLNQNKHRYDISSFAFCQNVDEINFELKHFTEIRVIFKNFIYIYI